MTTILLGTVALEPNRWAAVDPAWGPTIEVSDWLPGIAEAGFDGVELWERHATEASDAEVRRVIDSTVDVTVFNTYVGFDDESPAQRDRAAEWVCRTGATGVKYNVGSNRALEGAYAERVGAWLEQMPSGVRLLCECHIGISIAEDPATAARLFEAAGPPDRVQAIVHATSEDPDHIRSRFAAYGDRITHIHLNDPPGWDDRGARTLADMRDELEPKVDLLRSLGFVGTWTIEFVNGTGTENDNPAYLLERAADDLVVLRELLD